MEPIKVTSVFRWIGGSGADVMALYQTGGGVKIWETFRAVPNQERHATAYSREEWDRLVACVAWGRANEALEKSAGNASASARGEPVEP